MINTTSQNWQPGQTVKVGFLWLQVQSIEPTPGDGKPDAYILTNLPMLPERTYRFVPHHGLERIA